jgi:hypothetical protein
MPGVVDHLRAESLVSGLRGVAGDVRVYTCVVEGTRDNGYRGRGGRGARAEIVVITALPGREAADDQPYEQKRRSDMHVDLHDIDFSKPQRRWPQFPCVTAPPRYANI